jgi:hypothetical protein
MIIVSSYNVRKYDMGYVVGSFSAGVTVGLVWLAVPVAYYVLAKLSIAHAWKIGLFSAVVIALVVLTANAVALKGPEPGMRGESALEGKDILLSSFHDVFDPTFGTRWKLSEQYPRDPKPYFCTDPTFGRRRPAQKVRLEVDIDSGVDGRQLDQVLGRLRATGWDARAEDNGKYRGVPGRILRASRDGYSFESAVTYNDKSVASSPGPRIGGDFAAETPCLRPG